MEMRLGCTDFAASVPRLSFRGPSHPTTEPTHCSHCDGTAYGAKGDGTGGVFGVAASWFLAWYGTARYRIVDTECLGLVRLLTQFLGKNIE